MMFEAVGITDLVVIGMVLVTAYTVKGASSFGPSLIAVPFLTYIWPHPATFLPSLALLNLSGNLVLFRKYWRAVQWDIVLLLSFGTATGIPFGIFLLEALSASTLQLMVCLGILLALPFALGARSKRKLNRVHGFVAGTLSGVMGGSIGIDGPPYVLYLAARLPDDPSARYATTIATFTIGCIVRVAGFAAGGLVTGEGVAAALFGLPAMVVGISCGVWIFKRLSREAFDKLVLAILLGTVGSLLFRVGERWFLTGGP